MNHYLIVRTPTQIDLRELFVLGLGSKRGDETKIGHKGSGMKFTLALLHRLDSNLQVYVHGRHWRSQSVEIDVRGQFHSLIELHGDDGTVLQTNIAQNAGADTWVEPWFALRELVQNALDEKGTYELGVNTEPFLKGGSSLTTGGTEMRVLLTPELYQAWLDMADWMAPRESKVLFLAQKPGLYFHGFLIFPDAKWKYGWDVTGILGRDKLSEDRQLRNVDLCTLFRDIAKGLPAWPDSLLSEFLRNEMEPDLEMLAEGVFSEIRFGSGDTKFNPADFERIWFAKHGEKACFTMADAESPEVYSAEALGFKPIRVSYEQRRVLLVCEEIKNAAGMLPVASGRVTAMRKKDVAFDVMAKVKEALRLTRRLRPAECVVEVVRPKYEGDTLGAEGFACLETNRVMLLHDFAERATVQQLTATLVEEYMHIRSGAADLTTQFQRALVDQIASLLQPKRARSEVSL